MKNLATIITATYNNFDTISHFYQEIIQKTTCPFKLIIINNNSTEKKVNDFLKEINKHKNIYVFKLKQNVYYFPAINIGIKKANFSSKYTLILNDDIKIKSKDWIQKMIALVEADKKIAYGGDFMPRFNCPPFGGWIDGWCMFFKTRAIKKIGLFNKKYVWWYAPADYAIRAYKLGFIIKDFKKPGDSLGRISGIITHIKGQTFKRLKKEKQIPKDKFFPKDFNYAGLLKEHKLYKEYFQVKSLQPINLLINKLTTVKPIMKLYKNIKKISKTNKYYNF